MVFGISEKEGTVAMVDASPEVEALEKEVNHWRGYFVSVEIR